MQQVLFVCTGNTCRSPMAEYLFNQAAAQQGLAWRAASAGLYAGDAPMSPGALVALAKHSIDGSRHRARPLSDALVQDADLILCMTQEHLHALQARAGRGVRHCGGTLPSCQCQEASRGRYKRSLWRFPKHL